MDYIDYFTNQLPKNLASMAALRDEMAARQGAMSAVDDAMSAVDDANALKVQATLALETAKADAAGMLAAAQVTLSATEVDRRAVDARETSLKAREATFDESSERRVAAQDRADKSLTERESLAEAREIKLGIAETTLASNTKTLEARIVAFQAKVAALTA